MHTPIMLFLLYTRIRSQSNLTCSPVLQLTADECPTQRLVGPVKKLLQLGLGKPIPEWDHWSPGLFALSSGSHQDSLRAWVGDSGTNPGLRKGQWESLIGARERSVFRICSAPGKRPLSYMSIRQRNHAHFSRKLIRRLKRFGFLRLLRETPYSVAFFPAAGC